jgi:hypothetical protein
MDIICNTRGGIVLADVIPTIPYVHINTDYQYSGAGFPGRRMALIWKIYL